MENNNEDKWWQKNSTIPIGLNDVPICKNETSDVKNSDFIKLEKDIDKLVYKFIINHDIDGWWSFDYSIDNLRMLKIHGVGCPACDGSLCVFDENKESIIVSM